MSDYPPAQPAYPPVQNPAYPPSKMDQAYPPVQNPAYPPPQVDQAYPPPPPYQPQVQPPPAQTTVVVTQPVVGAAAPVFRDYPVTVTDSNGQQVQTVLEYRSGLLTYLVAAVLCLFLSELGLCCLALIPFCITELKDVYHITPTDGRVVGIYKRI